MKCSSFLSLHVCNARAPQWVSRVTRDARQRKTVGRVRDALYFSMLCLCRIFPVRGCNVWTSATPFVCFFKILLFSIGSRFSCVVNSSTSVGTTLILLPAGSVSAEYKSFSVPSVQGHLPNGQEHHHSSPATLHRGDSTP